VAAYLTQADVYVHSAIYEPFGLSILEAMATGLPVVAHNGGGNSEFMMNGKEGFLLDDLDPVLFAEKILEVVKSKDIYEQFSDQAYSRALHFTMEQYVDRLILLYENA
jgi:glycosyltransferase involved in cell wall biosynthesis